MSQEEILEVIKREPGIEQQAVHTRVTSHRSSVSEQIRALARKGDIRRVYVKRTYLLFPSEAV